MAKYFKNVKSYEGLKESYKELIKKNHPDNGGDVEVMKEINCEYDALFKIWKDRKEAQTGEEIKETAQSTRRHFYSAYGWEGSRYDSNLTLKEIAKIVRNYVKEKYPTCKFSIRTHYASMCQSLSVDLLEFPSAMYKTVEQLKAEGLTKHVVTTGYDGQVFEYDTYTDEVELMLRRLHANDYLPDSYFEEEIYPAYEKAIESNPAFFGINTEYFQSVIDDVNGFIASYNYDDSDSMTDYFDVNFYDGKVNYNNCKVVEKVARIKNSESKPATKEEPQPQQTSAEPEAIEQKSNKLTFKVTKGEDTRDMSTLWVVRIEQTLSRDEYIRINNIMKKLGGYYSKFKHGFIFRVEPSELLKGVA